MPAYEKPPATPVDVYLWGDFMDDVMRQCIRMLKKHTVDEVRKEVLSTLLDSNASKDKKIAAKILYMMDSDFADDGGPGSGNWGHKGRPGLRGGSGKGGGSHYRGGSAETGFESTRKDWTKGLSQEDRTKLNNLFGKRSSGAGADNPEKQIMLSTIHADKKEFKDYYEGQVVTAPGKGAYFSSHFEDGAFPDALEKDAKAAVRKYEAEAEKMIQQKSQAELRSMYPMLALCAKNGIITKKDLGKELIVRKFNKEKLKYAVVSDMMQGATKNRVQGDVGHKKSYYTGTDRRENLATEAFAEMYSRTLIGKDIEAIKEFFPTAHSVFERMMKKIGG